MRLQTASSAWRFLVGVCADRAGEHLRRAGDVIAQKKFTLRFKQLENGDFKYLDYTDDGGIQEPGAVSILKSVVAIGNNIDVNVDVVASAFTYGSETKGITAGVSENGGSFSMTHLWAENSIKGGGTANFTATFNVRKDFFLMSQSIKGNYPTNFSVANQAYAIMGYQLSHSVNSTLFWPGNSGGQYFEGNWLYRDPSAPYKW